eukprot:scaffold36438_cov197-Isochrysis_galbana.AAC.1
MTRGAARTAATKSDTKMTTRIMMEVCLRAWGHERRMRWALGRKADVGSCARRKATETKRS